jgi:hypothetical protein
MPRPPGFEPYTNLWIVRWQVNPSDELVHAGLGTRFPRIQMVGTRAAADELVAANESLSGPNQFQITPHSSRVDEGAFPQGATRYFNRKSYALAFFSGLAESVQVNR